MTILNIAHRGARSLAPENTIASAQKAFEIGADMWELDVAVSSDGELVIVHDDTLHRTSNARELFPDRSPWYVHNFTLSELRSLDFGSWFISKDPFQQISKGNVAKKELESYKGLVIPTLEEALIFTRENKWRVNVEIKDARGKTGDDFVVEKALALVDQMGMSDEVLLSSFNHHYIQQAKKIMPAIKTGALVSYPFLDFDPVAMLKRNGANTYNPGAESLFARQIKIVRQAGFEVFIWTVNDEKEMRRLIQAGASGLFTDFPQVLKKIQSEDK